MDLQTLYYAGEFLAALAVVGSLIFVGLQMRQNSKAMRNASTTALLQFWVDTYRDISSDPSLAKILHQVTNTDEPLDGVDSVRYRMWLMNALQQSEYDYLLYLDGHVDERHWDRAFKAVSPIHLRPAGRDVWSVYRKSCSDEFRKLMDEAAEKFDREPYHVENYI